MYLPISWRGLLYAFLLLFCCHLTNAASLADSCIIPASRKTSGNMISGFCSQWSNFRKTYATPAVEKVNDMLQSADNNFVMAGSIGNNALLFKINADGDTLWTRTFSSSLFYRLKQTADGGYIAAGYFNKGALLARLNVNGNVLWTKVFDAGTVNGEKASDVIETSDGGFALVGIYNANSNVSDLLVIKMDVNGNQQWNRRFDNGDTDWGTGIDQDADTLIIAAYTASVDFHDAILMKLNKNTGAVIWTKQYDRLHGNDGFYRFTKGPDGYLINGIYGLNFANNGFKHTITKTDINGNIIFSKLNNTLTTHRAGFSVSPATDGGFLCVEADTDGYLYRFDAAGVPVFKKRYPQSVFSHAIETVDHTYIMAGNAGNDILIVKTDADANVCSVDSTDATLSSSPLTVVNLTWPVVSSVTFNTTASPILGAAPLDTNTLCVYSPCVVVDTCTSCVIFDLTGPDKICSLKDTVTYSVDFTCPGTVTWNYDPAFVQLITKTDTTITVRFIQDGSVTIFAQLTLPCKILQNNIIVHVASLNDTLNAGPDRELCAAFTLTAPAGFATYLWQDGTTASSMLITQVGKYYLTVTNVCGDVLSDTVLVTSMPVFTLPDVVLCKADTLLLQKPTGFRDYLWKTNYRIDTARLKIYPELNTAYILTAMTPMGCPVADTFHATVLVPAPLHLGNDTSFCAGGLMTLDGGAGFNAYLWSNGSHEQQIQVNTQGIYWLHANGTCVSKDTLVITAVYPLPLVVLGNDVVLCNGTPRILNAGPGFSTYTWQDGSSLPTFSATQPGTYRVTVTDTHHCVGSDTLTVTGIAYPPDDFLPATIAVCDGEAVNLMPAAVFTAYSWSDGSSAPVITAYDFGRYWLEVTDANGCTGIDSVDVVDKDCAIFMHFPNAFTPNRDQQNDYFRPRYSGRLKQYHLTIYNRWGELVFETKNAAVGWDGRYKGTMQGTEGFVWKCRYQFAGKKQVEMLEKGIVTLLF